MLLTERKLIVFQEREKTKENKNKTNKMREDLCAARWDETLGSLGSNLPGKVLKLSVSVWQILMSMFISTSFPLISFNIVFTPGHFSKVSPISCGKWFCWIRTKFKPDANFLMFLSTNLHLSLICKYRSPLWSLDNTLPLQLRPNLAIDNGVFPSKA